MKHRANIEGGLISTKQEELGSRRIFAYGALIGLTLSATAILVGCENESDTPEKPYIDTDLDCRPFVNRNIPYDLESNNVKGLIRTIKTVDHKGPLEEGPCYDEALELVKQQVDPEYPYYGEVILPKFLVPEGTTLRQFKNQQ